MPDETPNQAPIETQPQGDRAMRRRLVRGEESALGELYDRHAPLVHGLALRFLADEEAAERVTGEVFAEAWERPLAYEPARGSLRSWLTELTHRRAERHLRERIRGEESYARFEERLRTASAAARADRMVTAMPGPLRTALELAYVRRRDYRAAAAELGVSADEARRRLRLVLQMLSTAVARTVAEPGTGRAS